MYAFLFKNYKFSSSIIYFFFLLLSMNAVNLITEQLLVYPLT
jgi:hypothetical protein